jgi:hypothetical protein
MNARNADGSRLGLSRIELLVVIAVLAVVAVIVLPIIARSRARGRGGYVDSTSYLKQIGLAVRVWSDDHGGFSPSQISTNQGGAKELIERGSVARYFQVMSNELGSVKLMPYMLDHERKPATNWSVLKDDNISFFVVPEADRTVPELWLVGDRHLATNRVPLRPGLFTMPASPVISWTADLDVREQGLCYADGHVEKPTSGQLQASALNAIAKYRSATTNTSFRLAIP